MSGQSQASGTSNKKHKMNRELRKLSGFLALRTTHTILLAAVLAAAVYLGMFLQSSQGLYALAAIFFLPYALASIFKERYAVRIQERFLLEQLAEHCHYQELTHLSYSISFVLEAAVLLLWQLGNCLFPYEVLVPQYLPAALLSLACILRALLPFFFQIFLRWKLSNNKF